MAVVQVFLRAALPAPNPWRTVRRVPSGHAGPAVERDPLQITPAGRSESRVALAGLSESVGASQPSAGRDRRTARRGTRSRRRGCRGGVKWRPPGDCRTGELYIAQLNIQSLKAKLPDLRHSLAEAHPFDIVALSETWLRPSVPARLLNVDGYRLYRHDRPADSGLPRGYGGVAVLARDALGVTVLETPHTDVGSSKLEIIWTLIQPSKAKQIIFVSLYRHPTNTARQISDDLDDLESQLQCIMSSNDCPIVIAGDLNINLIGPNTGTGYHRLKQLLQTYNLHICNDMKPTYRPAGSLLYVTITS